MKSVKSIDCLLEFNIGLHLTKWTVGNVQGGIFSKTQRLICRGINTFYTIIYKPSTNYPLVEI